MVVSVPTGWGLHGSLWRCSSFQHWGIPITGSSELHPTTDYFPVIQFRLPPLFLPQVWETVISFIRVHRAGHWGGLMGRKCPALCIWYSSSLLYSERLPRKSHSVSILPLLCENRIEAAKKWGRNRCNWFLTGRPEAALPTNNVVCFPPIYLILRDIIDPILNP